jgi:hypothetical protein
MNRLRAWLKEWQELVWFLVAAALLWQGLEWLRVNDPHAGIEGWANVIALVHGLFQGIVITFGAWVCKRSYQRDHTDAQEDAIWDAALAGNPWPLALDTLQWALWLAIWLLVYRLLG